MSDPRDILIAVPTLNEAARISRVCKELLQGLPHDRGARLLVVDGGSTDGTREIVLRMGAIDPRITFLRNSKRLQSAGINLAARHATPNEAFLIRADAHAGYSPGFVAAVVRAIELNDADSVVVPMDAVGTGRTARAIAWVSDTLVGSGGSRHRGGRRSGFVDHGHHAGWRLQSFKRAGGYDETFSHNEDAELDCRIASIGGQIWLDANIRMTYHVRSGLGGLFRQYRNYGRGRARTVQRHPRSLRLRQLLVPSATAANVSAILASAWSEWTLLIPATYLGGLALTAVHVAVRRSSLAGLLAGPAALMMHFGWTAGFIEGLLTQREKRWNEIGTKSGLDMSTR